MFQLRKADEKASTAVSPKYSLLWCTSCTLRPSRCFLCLFTGRRYSRNRSSSQFQAVTLLAGTCSVYLRSETRLGTCCTESTGHPCCCSHKLSRLHPLCWWSLPVVSFSVLPSSFFLLSSFFFLSASSFFFARSSSFFSACSSRSFFFTFASFLFCSRATFLSAFLVSSACSSAFFFLIISIISFPLIWSGIFTDFLFPIALDLTGTRHSGGCCRGSVASLGGCWSWGNGLDNCL